MTTHKTTLIKTKPNMNNETQYTKQRKKHEQTTNTPKTKHKPLKNSHHNTIKKLNLYTPKLIISVACTSKP